MNFTLAALPRAAGFLPRKMCEEMSSSSAPSNRARCGVLRLHVLERPGADQRAELGLQRLTRGELRQPQAARPA